MIILGGFLGSGKTSLLTQMARYLVGDDRTNPSKVVILENEIGEVGIDNQVLKSDGLQVEMMFSGCVCCTMAGDLIPNVYQIQDKFNPEWLIMEATGMAYPLRIKENLERSLRLDRCKIVCVVDARRWKKLEVALTTFMHDQLDGAEVIFVNKIDAVDDEGLEEVISSINGFNTEAKRLLVSAQTIIPDEVLEEALL